MPDEKLHDNDLVVDYGGVEVVIDKKSAPYLDGAIIDFEDSMMNQRFVIENPNAGGTCACGDSFH
jgi:iron-sulfur cluster assembly accessory protein